MRAISAASMPVICGVGHETDVTLADLAADLRAPTPTAAAELAAPLRNACLDQLSSLRVLDDHAQWLDRAAMRLLRPGQDVHQQGRRVALLAQRVRSAMHRPLEQRRAELPRVEGHLSRAAALSLALQRQRVSGLAGRLQALDPAQVLQRGFAWVTDESGHAVVSVREMQIGARLRAVLADGTAAVTVTDIAAAGVDRLQRQPE